MVPHHRTLNPDNSYTIRTATDDDFAEISELMGEVFGHDVDAENAERERLRFEANRDHIVVDKDGAIVGNAGTYTADFAVPGGLTPAALVTGVGVSATHRRQGLLTRLMIHQLGEIHAGGRESIAVLWASEGRIYQRFGYGPAAKSITMSIDSREVSLNKEPSYRGKLRAAKPTAVRAELQHVYERVFVDRPGWFSRHERWWSGKLLDVKQARGGGTALRATLYERDGVIDGYVLWRVKANASCFLPAQEVHVEEIVAATPEAYSALWRHLLTIDLTRSVYTSFMAVDEPIIYMVNEPQWLRSCIKDMLWLRIIDVPRALAGRRYACQVDTVIEVSDTLLPENAGRWRLRADSQGIAICEPCLDQEPDILCDISDLGAMYLGGVSLGRLIDAGRIRVREYEAVHGISAAWGWHRHPAACEMF